MPGLFTCGHFVKPLWKCVLCSHTGSRLSPPFLQLELQKCRVLYCPMPLFQPNCSMASSAVRHESLATRCCTLNTSWQEVLSSSVLQGNWAPVVRVTCHLSNGSAPLGQQLIQSCGVAQATGLGSSAGPSVRTLFFFWFCVLLGICQPGGTLEEGGGHSQFEQETIRFYCQCPDP
ncbi:Hypothetical predicted protein [Podarcis lilfordi]|uniref:Uncharacterized protein n=1 Tax=Podarcis lilfordi TaxID=74358 RepID=A0AA35P451_9SAUR|nr:Hypothetical predicted protein [Podarcis lilfordi]